MADIVLVVYNRYQKTSCKWPVEWRGYSRSIPVLTQFGSRSHPIHPVPLSTCLLRTGPRAIHGKFLLMSTVGFVLVMSRNLYVASLHLL